MLKTALTFTALLATPSALAYSPDVLLERGARQAPQALEGTSRQYLNPFNQVTIGFEHSWDHTDGAITADDNGRTRERNGKSKANQLTLQLKPKSVEALSSYRAYESSLRENTAIENRMLRSQSAKAAYGLLIRAAQAQEEQKLLADWNQLLDRTQKFTSIEARGAGDAKLVLKAANELDKARGDMAEINGSIAGVSHTLAERGLKLEELESDQILSAEEILAAAEKIDMTGDSLSRESALSVIETERNSIRLETAQRSQWLESLKFSVAKGNDDILRRQLSPDLTVLNQRETRTGTSYSLGISFKLPFLAAADLDEQRDRIKLARLQFSRDEIASQATERAVSLRTELKEKAALIAGMTTGKLGNTDALLRADPALAIELQRTSLSRRLMKIKLLAEVRKLYVDLLFETGRLADTELTQLTKRAGA